MSQAVPANLSIGTLDEVPTRPSVGKATVVSIATALLAGLGLGYWYVGADAYNRYLESRASIAIHLQDTLTDQIIAHSFITFAIVGGLCGLVGLISFVRLSATYQLLRATLFLVYPCVLGYAVLTWVVIGSLMDAKVEIDGFVLDRAAAVLWWWELTWPALAVGAYVFWLHVMLHSRSVFAAFTRKPGPIMRGDRILENWRTNGPDPRARKSFYGSAATHIFVLIIIPLLLQLRGCDIKPYRVPKGSGNPVVELVKMVKPKKEKKKTLTLRPNSAIIFEIPDLDDTQVDQMMEEMSQARYEARVNAKAGKLGKGGGKKGGWPEGMEDYEIRFIRLEHGGAGWDDGMNQTDADINFLRAFAQITGFTNIASGGESHPIQALARYPDDGFPPFVYLTGDNHMGRTSSKDREILREYCLNGGMLIADAGSARFDGSFRRFISSVFPDKQLLDIADEDMIYQLPFGFPNGAPAFWHHGGRRALGIKHDGRWIVFYHPGDMNDAWKSPGYSDVTPEMRDAAIQLGVNLVNYAFNQWNDAVARRRK